MDTVDGSRDFSYDSRTDGSSAFDASVNPGLTNGRASYVNAKQPVLALSPVRGGTMREYEQQINDLRKENFGLKLRIFYLEERGILPQPNSVDELDSTSSASSFQPNGRSKQATTRSAALKRCLSEDRSDATDSLVSDDDALLGGTFKDGPTRKDATTGTHQMTGSSCASGSGSGSSSGPNRSQRVPFADGGANDNGSKKAPSSRKENVDREGVDNLRKEVTEKTSLLVDAQRAIELALNEKRSAEDRLRAKQQEVEELQQQIQLISQFRMDGVTLTDSITNLQAAPIQIVDELPIDRYALQSVLSNDADGRPQLDRDALEELQSKLDEVYREFGSLPVNARPSQAGGTTGDSNSDDQLPDRDASGDKQPQTNLLRRIQELNHCIQKHFLATRNRQVTTIQAHAEMQMTGDAERALSTDVRANSLPFAGNLLNLSPCSSSFHSVAGTADTYTTSGSGGTHSVATVVKRPLQPTSAHSSMRPSDVSSRPSATRGDLDITAACRMLIEDFSTVAPNDSVHFDAVRRDDETTSHSADSQLNRTLNTNASEHELAELHASSNSASNAEDDPDGDPQTPTRSDAPFGHTESFVSDAVHTSFARENEALRDRIRLLEQHLANARRPQYDDMATSRSVSASNTSLFSALMRSKDDELEQLRERLRSLENFVNTLNAATRLDANGSRTSNDSGSQPRNSTVLNTVMRDLLNEIQRLRDENVALRTRRNRNRHGEMEHAENESRRSGRSGDTTSTLQSYAAASIKTSPLPLSKSSRRRASPNQPGSQRKSAMRRKSASASRLNTSLGSNGRSRAGTRFDLHNVSANALSRTASGRRLAASTSSDSESTSPSSSADEPERSATRTTTLSTLTHSSALHREREFVKDATIRELQRQVELLQAELASARVQPSVDHVDASTNASGFAPVSTAALGTTANNCSSLSTPRHAFTLTSCASASNNLDRSRQRLSNIIDELAESIPRVAEINESLMHAAQTLTLGETSMCPTNEQRDADQQLLRERDAAFHASHNQSMSTSALADGSSSSTINSTVLESLITRNFEVFAQFREQLAQLKAQILADATMTPSSVNLSSAYFESPAVPTAAAETPRLNALRFGRARLEHRRQHDAELDTSRLSQLERTAGEHDETGGSHRATFNSSRMPDTTVGRSILLDASTSCDRAPTDEHSTLEPTETTNRSNTVSLLPSQLDQTYAECLRLHETLLGIRQLSTSLLAQRTVPTETPSITNDDSVRKPSVSSRLRNLLVTPPETDNDLLASGPVGRQSHSMSQSSFEQFDTTRLSTETEAERGRLLENVTCALNQIKSLIVGIEDDRVNLMDEFNRILNEKRDLESQNTRLQTQFDELQADLRGYLEQLETHNAEKAQTLERLHDAELRGESERQCWLTEKRRLELENSELRQRCAEQLEKVVSIRATHDDMQANIAAARQESSRLQLELDDRAALVDDYQARLVRAEQDLASTGARLNDLTIRYGMLEKQASETSRREREASALCETYERKAASLEREIATLHDAHSVALRDAEERVQLAQDRTHTVHQELDALRDRLHDRENECDNLRRECSTLEHERSTSWQQMASLNEELDNIRHESHRLLEKVASMHTEKLQLAQRLQDIEAARHAALDEADTLRSQLGAARTQLEDASASKAEAERLRTEIERLKTENAENVDLLASQNDRLASANDRNATLLSDLANAQDAARAADQRASELDYRLRDRAAYATSLEAENARIVKENTTMMQALRDMVAKCRTMEDDHRRFVDDIREREADRVANLIDRELQTSMASLTVDQCADVGAQTSFTAETLTRATSTSMLAPVHDAHTPTQTNNTQATRLSTRVSYDELAKYAQKQKDAVKRLREVVDRNSTELAECRAEIKRLCTEVEVKNKRINELRAQLATVQRGSRASRLAKPETPATAPPSALFATDNVAPPPLSTDLARSLHSDFRRTETEVSFASTSASAKNDSLLSLLDRNANFRATSTDSANYRSHSPSKLVHKSTEERMAAVRTNTNDAHSASSSTLHRLFSPVRSATKADLARSNGGEQHLSFASTHRSYAESTDSSNTNSTFVDAHEHETFDTRRVRLLEAQMRALEEVNRTLRDELVTYERLAKAGDASVSLNERASRSIALSPMKSFYAHITPLGVTNESVAMQTSLVVEDHASGAGSSAALLSQLADVRSLRENLLRCIDDNMRLHVEISQQRADEEQQLSALKQLLSEQSVLIEQLRDKSARRKNKLRMSRALVQSIERQLELKQMDVRQLQSECRLLDEQLRGLAPHSSVQQPSPHKANLNTSLSASESGVSFGTVTARDVEKDRVIERLTAEIELLRGELRYSVELSEKLNANLSDYAATGRSTQRSQTDSSLTDLVTKQKQRLHGLAAELSPPSPASPFDRRPTTHGGSATDVNVSCSANANNGDCLPRYRLFAVVKLIDYELLCSQVKQARILLHGVKHRVDSRMHNLLRQLPNAYERIKNLEYSTLKEVNTTLEQAVHCEDKGHAILNRDFYVVDRNQLALTFDQPATRIYTDEATNVSASSNGGMTPLVGSVSRSRTTTHTNSSLIGRSPHMADFDKK